MPIINKTRLAVYDLLYKNILCEKSHNNKLEILVIGNSEKMIAEAVKAIFWCCQYPGISLSVIIAAKKNEAIVQLLTKDTQIGQYSKENSSFDYQIIKISGNPDILIKEIGNTYNFAVIASESESYSTDLKNKITSICECESILDYFGQDELIRIAYNINFCYDFAYDERIGYERSKQMLEDSAELNSSLAKATHIPYQKLYKKNLSNQGMPDKEIKCELAKFEHNRWCTYQISEGYKAIPVSLLDEFLTNTNSHKCDDPFSKCGLVHSCICDFGDNGLVLKSNESLWNSFTNAEDVLKSDLPDLDKVSLICHMHNKKLLQQKSKEIKSKLITKFSGNLDFCFTVNKLLNGESGSVTLYKQLVESTDEYRDFDNQYGEILINANNKIDYKIYDFQLVEMSPFCEWYKKYYTTAVVVCSGNCYQDMIIPTALMPDTVILVVPEGNSSYIKKITKRYLCGRKIQCNIITLSMNIESINLEQGDKFLHNRLNQYSPKDLVFCISDGVKPNVSALFGAYSYMNNYPCLTYSNGDILSFSSDIPLSHTMSRFKINVDEFFELSNWEHKNKYDMLPLSYSECMSIADVFFQYATAYKYRVKVENHYYNHYYTIWDRFSKCYSPNKINEEDDGRISLECKDIYNMPEVTDRLEPLADKLFNCLSDIKIIGNLKINLPKISFNIRNKEKYSVIANKSGTIFELYLYYRMLYTGIFDDIQMGVEVIYNGTINESTKMQNHHDNEIDIVAIKGFTPIIISCKSIVDYSENNSGNKAIYEVFSEAKQFHAIPVLAVSRTLGGVNAETIAGVDNLIKRAKICGVHLIDANILNNESNFINAINRIINSKDLVSPLDYE